MPSLSSRPTAPARASLRGASGSAAARFIRVIRLVEVRTVVLPVLLAGDAG